MIPTQQRILAVMEEIREEHEVLGESGRVTATDLAEHFGCSRTTIDRRLRGMEGKGWVSQVRVGSNPITWGLCDAQP